MDIIWTNILSGRGATTSPHGTLCLYLPFKRSPVVLQALNTGHDPGCRLVLLAAAAAWQHPPPDAGE